MSNEVKPWPDEYGRCDWGYYQEWKYAEAYAEAAMSRLRVAEKALREVSHHADDAFGFMVDVERALAFIGDLPPETGKA